MTAEQINVVRNIRDMLQIHDSDYVVRKLTSLLAEARRNDQFRLIHPDK